MERIYLIVIAWMVAWLVYIIAMVLTVYDGVLSLIFQPVLGALVATAFILLALLIGLIFKIRCIRSAWEYSNLLPAALALHGVLPRFLLILKQKNHLLA